MILERCDENCAETTILDCSGGMALEFSVEDCGRVVKLVLTSKKSDNPTVLERSGVLDGDRAMLLA